VCGCCPDLAAGAMQIAGTRYRTRGKRRESAVLPAPRGEEPPERESGTFVLIGHQNRLGVQPSVVIGTRHSLRQPRKNAVTGNRHPVDVSSPYGANLCPFYLGVEDGDLRPRRTILHNAGGPCKRFRRQSGYRVAATVQIGFQKGDRSKEDSNERKWSADVGLFLIRRSISSGKNIGQL